jgi:radical SAM-linked protein
LKIILRRLEWLGATVTDPRYFRLRCTFTKLGRLAMLSHLEVAHTLERTVRRSGLPFAVSEGFSPHMRIAFGSALPVGIGGTCEIFDLLLKEYVSPARALAALQEKCVPDMMVTSATYIDHAAKAASVVYPISTYQAKLSDSAVTFSVPDELRVVRKEKEKILIVNDFLVEDPSLDGNVFTFVLEAKKEGSMRPDLFARACFDGQDVCIDLITRVAQRDKL